MDRLSGASANGSARAGAPIRVGGFGMQAQRFDHCLLYGPNVAANKAIFTEVLGFDILPGVNVASSNTAVTVGSGIALLKVGGTTGLYAINLVNATASVFSALQTRA